MGMKCDHVQIQEHGLFLLILQCIYAKSILLCTIVVVYVDNTTILGKRVIRNMEQHQKNLYRLIGHIEGLQDGALSPTLKQLIEDTEASFSEVSQSLDTLGLLVNGYRAQFDDYQSLESSFLGGDMGSYNEVDADVFIDDDEPFEDTLVDLPLELPIAPPTVMPQVVEELVVQDMTEVSIESEFDTTPKMYDIDDTVATTDTQDVVRLEKSSQAVGSVLGVTAEDMALKETTPQPIEFDIDVITHLNDVRKNEE